MSDLSSWAEQLKEPLVLVGFVLMLFAGIITTLLKKKLLHLSKSASERILKQGLFYGFVLGIIVSLLGFGLAFKKATKEKNTSGNMSSSASKDTNKEPFTPSPVHIEQSTEGDGSPNIINYGNYGNGNVNNITVENK